MAYFSSLSVVSCDFSALCMYLCVFEVWASSSPLGYLCAKFCFIRAFIAELAHGEKSHTQSIYQSLTHSFTHSPSLFNAPGTKVFTLELSLSYLDSFLNTVDCVCQQTADFIIVIHVVSVSNAHKQNECWQTRQLLSSHSWLHVYNRSHIMTPLKPEDQLPRDNA